MAMMAASDSWTAFQLREPAWAYVAGLPLWTQVCAGASLLLIAIVVGIKLRSLPANLRARGRSTLDPTQLEELMLGSPPQIVDLRPKEAYLGEKGHIRGALNIPFAEFRNRIDELDISHPRPIVLVDEDDRLSHRTVPLLEARGHRWIYVLKGGFRAWRKARLPVYFTTGFHKK